MKTMDELEGLTNEERDQILIKQCNQGDGDSCNAYGNDNTNGNDDEVNYVKAVKYFKMACKLGQSVGCFNLGEMYRLGLGGEQNNFKAVECYKKSCSLGYDDGCKNYEKYKK